jgi:hypothetical protein
MAGWQPKNVGTESQGQDNQEQQTKREFLGEEEPLRRAAQ